MTDCGLWCGLWFLRKIRPTQLWVELSWVVAITLNLISKYHRISHLLVFFQYTPIWVISEPFYRIIQDVCLLFTERIPKVFYSGECKKRFDHSVKFKVKQGTVCLAFNLDSLYVKARG